MFVGEAIVAKAGSFDPETLSRGEPALPERFTWRGEEIAVTETVRTWRSTRTDRGDQYLDRVWFEFIAADGRHAVVYFDKHAKRPADRWRLYTLD